MNIYFSGSIYGGREKLEDYKKLIKELSKYGEVLNPEVADDTVIEDEENVSDYDIFENLEKEMNKADIIFGEFTIPSLGVGYEIGYADSHNKKIVGIYDKTITPKITTMFRGNKRLKLIPYTDINEIIKNLEKLINNKEE